MMRSARLRVPLESKLAGREATSHFVLRELGSTLTLPPGKCYLASLWCSAQRRRMETPLQIESSPGEQSLRLARKTRKLRLTNLPGCPTGRARLRFRIPLNCVSCGDCHLNLLTPLCPL